MIIFLPVFFRDETTTSCYNIPFFCKKEGDGTKKEQLLTVLLEVMKGLSKRTLRRSLHQRHHDNRACRIKHIVFAHRHRHR